LKRQDADLKRQQQLQMQQDLGRLATNPNPTARDYATVMTQYPQMAEHLKKGYEILQPAQQQAKVNSATQVMAALNAGANDVASELLMKEATALKNSGKDDEAKPLETMARLIELNPAMAKTTGALWLSSVMGADKFAATFPALGKEGRDATLAPSVLKKAEGDAADASIKELEAGNTPQAISLKNANTAAGTQKIYADINNASDRLTLDRDKLRSEVEIKLFELGEQAGKLPDDARKNVNEAVVSSVASKQRAAQLNDLATRFEKVEPASGIFGKTSELWKQHYGSQDEVTNLRKEYTRLRVEGVLKSLPPGPASDKDIKFAQSGFPDDTYDAKQLASFMRGMAKISQYDSVLNSAKAEWFNHNHSLGNAKRDITIDGVRVPTGTTFADFSAQFLKRKAEQLGAEQSIGQARALGRGYLRYGETSSGVTGAY